MNEFDSDQVPDLPPEFLGYLDMLTRLARAKTGLDSGGDPLFAASLALAAVVGFLQPDEKIREGDLMTPLRVLQEALADLVLGGRPPLFFERGRYKLEPERGGRPQSYSRARLHDLLTFCAEIMRKAGIPEEELGRFIAAEAERRGLRLQRNTMLTPRSIKRLQHETDRDGPPTSGRWLRRLREMPPPREPFTPEGAKSQVRHYLQLLAASSFPNNPPG